MIRWQHKSCILGTWYSIHMQHQIWIPCDTWIEATVFWLFIFIKFQKSVYIPINENPWFWGKKWRRTLLCRVHLLAIMGCVRQSDFTPYRVTCAFSSGSSTVIGAFGFNGRATVVDKGGLRLTSRVLMHQLVHAKCCKNKTVKVEFWV